MTQQLAPGLRVEVRDAEWRIKRIDHTTDGGQVIACEGLSELVRGRESLFLTKLEQSIRVLDRFRPACGSGSEPSGGLSTT